MKNYQKKFNEIMCELERNKNKKSYKKKREIYDKILLTKTICGDKKIVKEMMRLKSIEEVDEELLLNIEEIEKMLVAIFIELDEVYELNYKELGKIKVLVYCAINEMCKSEIFTKEIFCKKFDELEEWEKEACLTWECSKII